MSSRGGWRTAGLGAALVLALACGSAPPDVPHKVYVILGFHGNFYHSWRGDTPDEAGFGTDIRVVRGILRMLDQANARGLDARGYWDTDHLFTFESILPEHAPDIIEGIRRRVAAGRDEILLMPYDNGLLHAMTRHELRMNTRWAISNPWGSGALDLFGRFTPIIRPQEMTLTPGALTVLRDNGVEGIVLLYASVPFNALSAFVPVLPPEQRYGATWLRLPGDETRMVLLPCASVGDVVDHVSFERWLLDLRALQTSGRVRQDLLLHINADADLEFWLPTKLPPGLNWIPNAGGLVEYIEAVNKYDWAEFTTPSRFLADHEPTGEVVVRQDLADGAWDGQYSWAEKFASHGIWSVLEQSRLATRRAEALAHLAPDPLRSRAMAMLWDGRDSSFFHRVRALSTTHFGMSTPVVNEERQAVAEATVAQARAQAERAERRLAAHAAASGPAPEEGALYAFEVRDLRKARRGTGPAERSLLRLPVVFDGPPPAALDLVDAAGRTLPHSLVGIEDLGDGRVAAEVWALLSLFSRQPLLLELRARPGAPAQEEVPAAPPRRLANGELEVALEPASGIASLRAGGHEIGGPGFLSAFVTYRSGKEPVSYPNGPWEIGAPAGERLDGLARARLRTRVPFATPEGETAAEIEVTLSLPEGAPWLVADAEVAYPYTTKRDLLHTPAQKLRRYLDLRWIEVAPFQLRPSLEGSRDAPLRVWKHNYLDVTSHYDLDYAWINPRNAELDAFNHHVTAGWVAVTDGRHGLLVAEDGDVRSSFAFAPMRLREQDGRQALWINPFGSYHGRQLDYSHLDGTGLGAEITELFSSSLRPNGPSYNGQRERFSLLLAPYAGDAPPEGLRSEAGNFFAAPAVVYRKAPAAAGAEVLLARDVRETIDRARRARARQRAGPLPVPRAFLVNPTAGAADLVWDEPDDPRVDGYEVAWRRAGAAAWEAVAIPPTRRHRVGGLEDGAEVEFRLRALGAGAPGEWTETARIAVGPVPVVDVRGSVAEMPLRMLLRLFGQALIHAWSTRFGP